MMHPIHPLTVENALAAADKVVHQHDRGTHLPVFDHDAIVALCLLVVNAYQNLEALEARLKRVEARLPK